MLRCFTSLFKYLPLTILLVVALPVSAAVVKLPSFPQPSGSEIVGANFQNPNTGGTAAGPVQLGQAFVQGDLPGTSGISAKINGVSYPAQIDVKTKYADGSAKYGVITVMAPAFGANTTNSTLFAPAAKNGTNISLATLPGYAFKVDLSFSSGAIGNYSYDVAKLVTDAVANGTISYWRQGPVVTEGRVEQYVTSSLRLVIDVAKYSDGRYETHVQFNNDRAMTATGGRLVYTATVTQNGVATTYTNMDHYQYQQWHRVFWTTPAPNVNVQSDIVYLKKTGAIHQYDLSLGIDTAVIDWVNACLADPNWNKPFSNNCITTYMPMTGGRGDIGPVTLYATAWLMTQDATLAKFVLGQGDAAAHIPWHMWDAANKTWLNTDNYPNLWTDGRGGTGRPGDPTSTGLTQQVNGSNGNWGPDTAHRPSLSYIPYLLRGDRYYLDQVSASAADVEMSFWPSGPEYGNARNFGQGLVISYGNQVRGGAWSLRELVHAAWANPDGSTEKSYFTKMVNNNLDWAISRIPVETAAQGQLKGMHRGVDGGGDYNIKPWQQDFLMSSIAAAAQMGFETKGREYMTWLANWSVGRFTNGSNGFNPRDGIHYNLPTAASASTYQQTWRAVGDALLATGASNGTGWAQSQGYYGALGLMSLAMISNTIGSSAADSAYAWLKSVNPPGVDNLSFQKDPTFHVVPNGVVPPPPPSAVTVSLSGAPATITAGQSATLTWSSTNANSCVGTGFTASGLGGSVTVTPSVTTTYTVTCTGANGSASADATIVVGTAAVAPTASLVAYPTTINVGQSATISWSSTNASSCVGTGFTANGTNNSVVVTPSVTTTYTVTCTGAGGSASAQVTITVNSVTIQNPTATLTASPTTITAGQSTTLTWSSTNASYCISDQFNTSEAKSGSVTVTPMASTVYRITCGGNTSVTAQVTVTVGGTTTPAPTVSLSANPSSITSGGSATLTWSTTNATACITSGFSGSGTSGSVVVTPAVTTTYTVACTGAGGTSFAQATINVSTVTVQKPVVSFTASPASVTAGGSATLTWASTNANWCISDQFNTSEAKSGSVTVTPAVTTTHTISCGNEAGNTTAQVTVSVSSAPATPTATLSANPTSILYGQSTTLTWSSTNAASCTGAGFVANGTSGSVVVSPVNNGTTYSINCGGATASVTIKVTTTTTSAALTKNMRVYTTDNLNVRSTARRASGNVLCTQPTNSIGTIIDGPRSNSGFVWWKVNFDTSCDGWVVADFLKPYTDGSSSNASSTGSMPTVTFTASPLTITVGQSSTLSWSATNATVCTGSGFTAEGVSGSVTVKPSLTTQYAISCAGPAGVTVKRVTVTVNTTTTTGSTTTSVTTTNPDVPATSTTSTSNPSTNTTTYSPDGTIISLNEGTISTAQGTWKLAPEPVPGGYMIMLNNTWANNGGALKLQVANGGKVYAYNNSGNWYVWDGSVWRSTTDPAAITTSAAPSDASWTTHLMEVLTRASAAAVMFVGGQILSVFDLF